MPKKKITVKLEPRRCKYCGRYFEPPRPSTRYCSQECYASFYREFYREYERKRRAGKAVKPTPIVKCLQCGSEFERKSSTHVYCSNECVKLARRKLYLERKEEGSLDQHPKSQALRSKTFDYVQCNRCDKMFRSWDKTKNRRCAKCQAEIESTFAGADPTLLENIR